MNDYIGRSLCEHSVSDWTVTLTLTYRTPEETSENPLAHKILHPPHFQKFIRALRRRGHKIRYLATGEYGEFKGRAHFHCILFGKGKAPDFPQKKNFHNDVWPHGHMFADWDNDERSFRYVCKYIVKDLEEPDDQGWFTLSKKPALGHEWFMAKARFHVEQGVFPRSFNYFPPGASRHQPYMMRGAIKRDFLSEVAAQWREVYPLDRERVSEWVAEALDKNERDAHRAWAEEQAKGYSIDEYIDDVRERLDRERIKDRRILSILLDSAEIFDA